MTLRELRDKLATSPEPKKGEVRDLTLLAIRLQKAGVRPTVEDCADRASFAAWLAAAAWVGPTEDLEDAAVSADRGQGVYLEAARLIMSAIPERDE